MRKIVILGAGILISILIAGWLALTGYQRWMYRDAEPVSFEVDGSPIEIIPLEKVAEMLAQLNQESARRDLQRLTGAAPICIASNCTTIKHRRTGSEGLVWAKDYISSELLGLGYSVEIQDWSTSGFADQNILALKAGTVQPEEWVYFIAHMDSKLLTPGTDDNASGVAGLLALARVIQNYSFERSVGLLFTSGEEQGAFGVWNYINQLTPQELNDIIYAINVDMIGFDANQDGVMELWHANHPPSMALAQIMHATIKAYQLELKPGFVVGCG